MTKTFTKEDVINAIKKDKVRIMEINHSDNQYEYVEKCLKQISEVQRFHYNGKNISDNDHCYYGFRIGKKGYPMYLFVDKARRKIVVYDSINKKEMYLEGYNELKEIIEANKKSPVPYIIRNTKTDNLHRIPNILLIIALVALIICYAVKYLNDSRFSAIALYIADVIALQDCVTVFQKYFEYKSFDKKRILAIILEILSLIAILCAFILPLDFNSISTVNNYLCAFVTLGTVLLKAPFTKKK